MNIEEDIKILNNYLEQQDRKFVSEHRLIFLQAIENILAEYKRYKNMYEAEHRIHLVRNEQLERKEVAVQKANKYDSLVEKIKEEHVKAKNIYSETLSPYQYGKVDVLEELLQSIK